MSLNYQKIIILAIGMLIGFGIASAIHYTDDSFIPTETSTSNHSVVTIGMITSLTGDLSFLGLETSEAAKLAVDDFNKYLKDTDASWRLKLVIEDSATSPVQSLEKLTSLYSKGIDVVVGLPTSAGLRNMAGYAESNNILLFSCCSNADTLGIPDDNIFRLTVDATTQASAIVSVLDKDEITVMIPVWRGDAWGDSLSGYASEYFKELGGIVDEGIRYNPESPEFSASVSFLAEKTQEYVSEYGKDNVAIVMYPFEELVSFMQSSSEHDVLNDIKWYDAGVNAQSAILIQDDIAREFATQTQLLSILAGSSSNSVNKHVQSNLFNILGQNPSTYAYATYDSVWLVGFTILDSGASDVNTIKANLPKIASKYVGSIGDTSLNNNDDLAQADYDLWRVVDGQWTLWGVHDGTDDNLQSEPTRSPVLESMIPSEVLIGAILPLTGDLTVIGQELLVGTRLAVDDFNNYLKESGETWHLTLLVEDSATNPVQSLEKLTTLHSRGVDVIVGAPTSAGLRNMAGYAEFNNMLLFSCCSNADTLGIPDDNIFRMTIDASHQGPAIAAVLNHDALKVYIPVWRGDAWGDALSKTTSESFTARGGISDEGIRYNPESPEFSTSVSLLAEKTQKYVSEYGADNVGIVLFGFAELSTFMQSASGHDILDDVKWYDASPNAQSTILIEDPITKEFATNTRLVSVIVGISDNDVKRNIESTLLDTLGHNPVTYTYGVYDSVWLVGLTMQNTQSTDVDILTSNLHDTADTHMGSLGSVKLNDAGDLAQANYDLWAIIDGEWILWGTYDTPSDTVMQN